MVTISDTERRGRGRRPALTEEQKDKVILSYKKGIPVVLIASNTGISKSSVYRILSERTEK